MIFLTFKIRIKEIYNIEIDISYYYSTNSLFVEFIIIIYIFYISGNLDYHSIIIYNYCY